MLALVYIDRIIQSNPNFVVNSLNIHRLLITSVMLAAKFFDDQYFNNAYYAKVGGVPRGEMNSLEVEFLFMTNFTLFVPTEQYRQYYTELCNHAKNSACSCSAQHGKIPDLAIPVPDAGTFGLRQGQLQAPKLTIPAYGLQEQGQGQAATQPGMGSGMMTDSPALGMAPVAARGGEEATGGSGNEAGPAAMAF